jgi:hypothetical protein
MRVNTCAFSVARFGDDVRPGPAALVCAALNCKAGITSRDSIFRIHFALNFGVHRNAATSTHLVGSNSGQIHFSQFNQGDVFASLI